MFTVNKKMQIGPKGPPLGNPDRFMSLISVKWADFDESLVIRVPTLWNQIQHPGQLLIPRKPMGMVHLL